MNKKFQQFSSLSSHNSCLEYEKRPAIAEEVGRAPGYQFDQEEEHQPSESQQRQQADLPLRHVRCGERQRQR